jgi:hypothetical protein
MKFRPVHRLAGLLPLLCVAGIARADDLVFQNINLSVGGKTNEFSPDTIFHDSLNRIFGDEISLAGTARQVTQVVIAYFGDISTTATDSVTLRLYANDGVSLPNVNAPRPNSLLWQSDPFKISPGANQITFPVPNIVVPNTLTWAVQFSGITGVSGNNAGLLIANPPTVGATLNNGVVGSYNDFWIQTDPTKADSWALYQLNGGSLPANFYVSVYAVPEPSALALGAGGVMVLWWLGRRR